MLGVGWPGHVHHWTCLHLVVELSVQIGVHFADDVSGGRLLTRKRQIFSRHSSSITFWPLDSTLRRSDLTGCHI